MKIHTFYTSAAVKRKKSLQMPSFFQISFNYYNLYLPSLLKNPTKNLPFISKKTKHYCSFVKPKNVFLIFPIKFTRAVNLYILCLCAYFLFLGYKKKTYVSLKMCISSTIIIMLNIHKYLYLPKHVSFILCYNYSLVFSSVSFLCSFIGVLCRRNKFYIDIASLVSRGGSTCF